MPYVPLHFRSYFSLLRGCRSPEDVCRLARERGFPAVGLADRNNLYGVIRFLKAARREGIKPVAGVEVAPGGEHLFTAYIMDRRGWARINGILTALLGREDPAALEDRAYDPVADRQHSRPCFQWVALAG